MATKKIQKKVNVKGSGKKQIRTAEKQDAQPVDKTALKREKFLARRNNDIVVIRISTDILMALSEKAWSRGGQAGAGTIAREVFESWYVSECHKANKSV